MKLKSFLYTGLALFASHTMFAQANILNAKIPEEIGMKTEAELLLDNDKPLEYGYVGDRDILFSKMTWEKIVLDERVNFPLYYPVDTNNIGSNRRSLFDVYSLLRPSFNTWTSDLNSLVSLTKLSK